MPIDTLNLTVKQKKELFEIIDDIFSFSNTYYDSFIFDLDNHFQQQESMQVEHSMIYYPHLYWWAVFCAPFGKDGKTIFDYYLHKRLFKFKRKRAILNIVLQWRNIHPSFYVHVHSLDERVLLVKDLFDHSYKIVTVYNNNYKKPAGNQLLTGLVLPFGNRSYCTIIDFLHISSPKQSPEEDLLLTLRPTNLSFVTPYDLTSDYPSFLARCMKSLIEAQTN